MADNFFPGPPGHHIPGPKSFGRPHGRHEEVRNLNQYTGYFTTPEGDFPVSVVADSIKEAAKILAMPGVFGEGVNEPTTIKFVKGKIAVTIPVRTTGFRVVIDPVSAVESGAYATPSHADVKNGTEVIFTAHEPFGWKFEGWYKGDQLISTEKVTTIEVYDPYSSLIQYRAVYEPAFEWRNGRYLELGHGWYFDFKFDGWSNYVGKLVLHQRYNKDAPATDYHFVITNFDEAEGTIKVEQDASVVQDETGGFTGKLEHSPVGYTLTFETGIEALGISEDQVLSLKWVADQTYS